MTNRPASAAELDTFVRTAKAAGVPDDALVRLLQQNGWSERRVYASLSSYYGETLGIPTPSRSDPSDNPRDAFYYLLNFITLGFWTVALGQIFYDLIARAFPDRVSVTYQGSIQSELAWQLATVMIAFPCFLFLGRLIARELQRRPDAARSGARAWITYIALVVAALVVLGDGIFFLYALLRGELTIKFVLDSLVLLVIGGGVFAYYLAGQRTPAEPR
jgi:Domain of unknown function (DUF5671)